MKILYFSRDYTTHDHRFLTALSNAGYSLAYLRLERQPLTLEDRPLPPGVEPITWAGGQRPFHRAGMPILLEDLRRVLDRGQPDLLHAGPIQSAALLSAQSGFRPLVSMSWGSDLLVDADRDDWHRQATRYTLSRSDALVGDCRPVRQQAVRFGMPDEKIFTFPWGVDLAQFSPAVAGSLASEATKPPTFTLLSTRAWEPIYGVDVIARAFALAARQRPELRLVMLGGGSLADDLQRIFSDAGVLAQVRFPGQVRQAELPGYYRQADLYVSASHSDGTSISLLEALACGRPALVSDIPGNREWIQPGVQGWLFPDGDPQALAERILSACGDADNMLEMGAAARRLAEQRADWSKNFPELLRAYAAALGVRA